METSGLSVWPEGREWTYVYQVDQESTCYVTLLLEADTVAYQMIKINHIILTKACYKNPFMVKN